MPARRAAASPTSDAATMAGTVAMQIAAPAMSGLNAAHVTVPEQHSGHEDVEGGIGRMERLGHHGADMACGAQRERGKAYLPA